jgi:hypothetical protein
MSGKGSDQRPTDHKKFSDNYDLIFGKKNEPVQDSPSTERTLAQVGNSAETNQTTTDSK